jgi:hypothetical protein
MVNAIAISSAASPTSPSAVSTAVKVLVVVGMALAVAASLAFALAASTALVLGMASASAFHLLSAIAVAMQGDAAEEPSDHAALPVPAGCEPAPRAAGAARAAGSLAPAHPVLPSQPGAVDGLVDNGAVSVPDCELGQLYDALQLPSSLPVRQAQADVPNLAVLFGDDPDPIAEDTEEAELSNLGHLFDVMDAPSSLPGPRAAEVPNLARLFGDEQPAGRPCRVRRPQAEPAPAPQPEAPRRNLERRDAVNDAELAEMVRLLLLLNGVMGPAPEENQAGDIRRVLRRPAPEARRLPIVPQHARRATKTSFRARHR